MKFEATVPTDALLRERYESRLFELYHENSKLSHNAMTPHLSERPTAATNAERYITTRGFRQYDASPRVELPTLTASSVPLQDVLLRRRSRRELGAPIDLSELGTLLTQSLGCTAIVQDHESETVHALRAWPSAGGLYPLDAYLICAKVKGLLPGIYHYNPIAIRLELLTSRPVEVILADAYFNQKFAIEAALSVCLVASFDRTVAKYGERGYRLVLLDAGHAAQNLLLTAEQLGLGAVAVAGYCDDRLAGDLGFDGVSEAVVHTVLIGKTS